LQRENRLMQDLSRALRHLAIIALLVRAMVPAGWMPEAHGGLVICSAGTLGTIHHDGDKTPAQASHEECAFAAVPHLAAAPDAPQIALPAFHAFAARTDNARAQTIAARFSPASPRAPPLTG
jgi:hypothetical protein